MIAAAAAPPNRGWLRDAVRIHRALVAVLAALAAAAWWWTREAMRGMDNGPWTSLGTLGWFLGVWVVMMAAMMFPSVAPTVALYARTSRAREPLSPYLFAAGYLATWTAAGLAAFGATAAGGSALQWSGGGRWLAGLTLVAAALYELTPLKEVCLAKCRSPLGAFLASWRGGLWGAVRMGARNGAWCVGCCWALMASLFALGVMSIVWMAFVAVLIAGEKLLPWRRPVVLLTAAVLAALGVAVLVAPQVVPALVLPPGMTMP
jgi:predicted metal-binding membrane protein